MKILMTGGTGFIGSALTRRLRARGDEVTVISRHPDSVSQRCGLGVYALKSLSELDSAQTFDCIVNLAGAPIFGRWWTKARKRELMASRVGLTDALVETISRMARRPKVFLSGSAVGYYGSQDDSILTEHSKGRPCFSHELCAAWEHSALQAESLSMRVCLVRTGLVLGQNGGLLPRLLLQFKLGLGGRLGNGRQWMSWIHLDDWLSMALAIIDTADMRGVYNATAPNPVINRDFTKTLAGLLHRPAIWTMPAGLLKVLLGEMSELVLGSQRVIPQRLLDQGFTFHYTDLKDALAAIMAQKHGPS